MYRIEGDSQDRRKDKSGDPHEIDRIFQRMLFALEDQCLEFYAPCNSS